MKTQFIKVPNSPQNRVKAVIIGDKYDKLVNSFNNMGIIPVIIGPNCIISPNVKSHADMSVFHAGSNKLIISRHVHHSQSSLENLGFEVIKADGPSAAEYPGDIALNACIIGNLLFHKAGCTDLNIIKQSHINKWRSINVNQGYTKCSICILDETHIITSDKGIHKKAKANGIDSLLINPGQIRLDGYNTGFIGGACGKLSKNEIAFTGTLKRHTDEKRIIEYIKNIGMNPVFLSDEPIYDIGSIIPVIEASEG